MGCTSCRGGGGTGGRGRTPYTPKKTGSPFSGGNKIAGSGSSKKDVRASEFGVPKVRASFSSRNR